MHMIDFQHMFDIVFPHRLTPCNKSSERLQTNSTPAAPANAPATPIILCCPFTPTGAAAAVLCVAAPLPLELALELALALALALLLADALLADALAALPDDVTVTTLVPGLVPAALVTVLNSVGIVVLNSSVMGAAGANAVVVGVFVPIMLVSGC